MKNLENEKMEVVKIRRDNIRKMKMLSRQKKPLKNDQQENASPLRTLSVNSRVNSNLNMKSSENIQEKGNAILPVLSNGCEVEQNAPEFVGLQGQEQENNENKENSMEEEARENTGLSAQAHALETRRLKFRAEAAKEIRAANEVKRAELMRLAEERNEARLKREIEEAEKLENDKYISYRTDSAGSVGSNSLDWSDNVSYADPFADQPNALHDIKLEPNSVSADVLALKQATQDLARAIAACDVKLSDIQVMQSIILAEEAAQDGRNEFNTLERLSDLDTVTMSFSTTSSRNPKQRRRFGSRIGSVSRRAAPRLTQHISQASKRARPHLTSRIEKISKRTVVGIKTIKNAAAMIDQRRRNHMATVNLQA